MTTFRCPVLQVLSFRGSWTEEQGVQDKVLYAASCIVKLLWNPFQSCNYWLAPYNEFQRNRWRAISVTLCLPRNISLTTMFSSENRKVRKMWAQNWSLDVQLWHWRSTTGSHPQMFSEESRRWDANGIGFVVGRGQKFGFLQTGNERPT